MADPTRTSMLTLDCYRGLNRLLLNFKKQILVVIRSERAPLATVARLGLDDLYRGVDRAAEEMRNEGKDVLKKNTNRAYRRGLKSTERPLKKVNVTFGASWTLSDERVFGELAARDMALMDGFTAEVSRNVKRELATGWGKGEGMSKLAGRLTKVTNIGQSRALTIARSETVLAYVKAAETRYMDAGVRLYDWLVGGGPCPSGICPQLEAGAPYSFAKRGHPLPIQDTHPRCTCSIVAHFE